MPGGVDVVTGGLVMMPGSVLAADDHDAVVHPDHVDRDPLAVHVARSDGLAGASPATLAAQRRLVESFGRHLPSDNRRWRAGGAAGLRSRRERYPAGARREPASWLATVLTGPGIGARTIHGSGDIDVHIVTHAQMGRRRGLPARAAG